MFREMRRKNQALEQEECLRILRAGENGVLAMLGDEDYPYALPMNYAYADDRIYFHCAPRGHKIDALCACEKVSFCVIAFGRARLVEETARKRRALEAIGARFCPDTPEKTAQEIEGAMERTAVIEMQIEHLSGKESRALAQERRRGGEA